MIGIVKRRIVSVFLVTLTLMLGLQGAVLATASSVEVTGQGTMVLNPYTGSMWVDGGGNTHVSKVEAAGSFALHSVVGDSVSFVGTQTTTLSCVVDATGSGPCSGPVTITAEDGTPAWEGHVHGKAEGLIFCGQMTARGRGIFEGAQLKLDMQEIAPTPGNPDPNVYINTGRILYPHGK
jgi:hypothetical protein